MGVCLPFSKSFRCRFRDITLVGHFAHCRSKQHIVGSQQRVERVYSFRDSNGNEAECK